MGLRQVPCGLIHDGLHSSGTPQVPTSHTDTTTTCPPHLDTAQLDGANIQLTTPKDTTTTLSTAEIKCIQQITGTLLYYARAVDATLLVALGTIAAQQARGTATTARAINHKLDYCHTHPDAVICYCRSDMILKIHSDASYLSEAKACSHVGGHFYMGNKPSNCPKQGNGPLLNKSTIM
jgi:hypothetical protein